MYPKILSLIYVLYVLHIPCAARVIIKDTGTNYGPAQLDDDNLCKEVAPGMDGVNHQTSPATII
jgi:hypothetical protein